MLKKIVIFIVGFLYDLVVPWLILLLVPISVFSSKIREYVKSRSSIFKLLRSIKRNERPAIIFYCSSVGEFEQSEPLIRKMKEQGKRAIIFFHSKKGYDYGKKISDCEIYLCPFDLFSFWLLIINKIKPERFIINRHEFWPGTLLASALSSHLYIVNYIVKPNASVMHRLAISLSKKTFTVNDTKGMGDKFIYTGDMRKDRLMQRSVENKQKYLALRSRVRHQLEAKQKLLVLGNCYDEDLKILKKLNCDPLEDYRFLIIPARAHLKKNEFFCVTNSDKELVFDWKKNKVIRFNTIGNLFELYGCADIAWVGGGFTSGIHNCLEPDFFDVPMISGPNLNRQYEAELFFAEGKLNIFEDELTLEKLLRRDLTVNKKGREEESATDLIYTSLNENNYTG